MIGITKDSLSVLSWNGQQICFNYEISGLDMSCTCIHSKNSDQDKVELTEEEKLRKAANRRRDKLRRCIYFGSETDEQRENRLIKQRERSRKNLASKTAEETRILKQENNRKQRERRSAETSNQKFWRLLRRRQYDKFGLHMNCIDFEYHRSKQKYGIDIDFASENDEFVVGASEVGMKTVFSVFFDMIDLALAGRTIPLKSFKMFDHYGIYMPEEFFTDYMDDLSYYKLTP